MDANLEHLETRLGISRCPEWGSILMGNREKIWPFKKSASYSRMPERFSDWEGKIGGK